MSDKKLTDLTSAGTLDGTELMYIVQGGNDRKVTAQDVADLAEGVTSVAVTVPTGLTVSGSPITTSGTLSFGLASGYVIPLQSTLDGKANLSGATFTGNVSLGGNTLTGLAMLANSSAGGELRTNGGTQALHWGSGGGANGTLYGGWNYDSGTANTLVSLGASKTFTSLDTATYPSLTEVSYVKGVTSAIQTQLNAKAPLNSPTFTGTVTLPAGQVVNGVTLTTAGGTTNFLRADGTYAAPTASAAWGSITGTLSSQTDLQSALDAKQSTLVSGTNIKTVNGASILGSGDLSVSAGAGGSNTQVQYNNGGSLAGAANISITAEGNLHLATDTAVPAPTAEGVTLFAREVAGRRMPAYVSPSGIDSALQPLLARNKIGYWCPPGNANTVPGVLGFTAITATNFTATARNVATTNMFTRMRRLGYVTAATSGTVGNWRMAVYQYTVGDSVTNLGGFTYIVRFGISDAAEVAGARMFMGMRASSTPSNVEPSTLTNCIGVGHGAADTNMKLFYGGSAAQTPIDLGANFPANTRSTDVYELALFSPPDSGDVKWQVTRLNTGDVATGTITNSGATVLPTNTTLLAPWGYRTNNATSLAVGLDVISAYIETDY